MYVPECPECLSPMLTVAPLQLMAYYAGVARVYDVDKPRTLANSRLLVAPDEPDHLV